MNQKIVVTDVETGGTDPQEHSLLQVALVVFENGRELDALKLNIVHDVYRVTPRAMEINKIDLETHEGYKPEEAVQMILEFMKKHFEKPAQVCGHNVGFDVGFLKVLFKMVGVDYDKIFSYRLLDTSAVARFLVFAGVIPPRGSLGDLAKHFNVPHDPKELHDALVDCRVTYQLLVEMTKMFPSAVTDTDVSEAI